MDLITNGFIRHHHHHHKVDRSEAAQAVFQVALQLPSLAVMSGSGGGG